MKKRSVISFVLILFFLIMGNAGVSARTSMPSFDPDEGIYILDPDTGDAYYTQNENETYYPASTTKLLTALTAMDVVADRLQETVVVGEEIEMIAGDSSTADLTVGESCTLVQLFYGLLLPSGNDAAMTIAVHTARIFRGDPKLEISEALSVFTGLMNEKAKALGADRSVFVNPHGYHDPEHRTTPHDMALIAKAAFENPTIAKICKTTVYSYTNTDRETHRWFNSNILIYPEFKDFSEEEMEDYGLSEKNSVNPFYHSGVSSGKTGFTDEAQCCLVFSGSQNDMRMIGVILKASDHKTINTQAKGILDSTLSEYTHYALTKQDDTLCSKVVFGGQFWNGILLKFHTAGVSDLTIPEEVIAGLTQTMVLDPHYLVDHGPFLTVTDTFTPETQVGFLKLQGTDYMRIIPLYPEKGMRPIGIADLSVLTGVMLLVIALVVILVIRKKQRREDFGKKL